MKTLYKAKGHTLQCGYLLILKICGPNKKEYSLKADATGNSDKLTEYINHRF